MSNLMESISGRHQKKPYLSDLLDPCICRASARPPASQSTVPHFPSSLDGIRNRKGSKWSRLSELINQTLPSKSDTAQFGA